MLALSLAVAGIVIRKNHDRSLSDIAASKNITPVTVVTPTIGSPENKLVLPGSVRPLIEASIHARVNGYLKIWYTDIGSHVRQGQVLAIIETPELDDQIRRAEAEWMQAKGKLTLARTTASRWRGLIASDSVSRQETDEKEENEQAMLAQEAAAQANLNALKAQSAFNRVTAPFDGIITERQTDIGMLINAGSGPALFKIEDPRKLRVYLDVPQQYSDLITPNLHAQVSFPEHPEKNYPATLFSTSVSLSATSRTLTVELMLDNSEEHLKSGTYANVYLSLPGSSNALRLPASTLIFRRDNMQVATIDANDKVILKSVQIGRDYGSTVEIVSGLNVDDRVVDSPSDSLAGGDKVLVVHGNRS